ncbi:MAG TPA: type III-B CRISPR module RAMP protein Cmr4 [candidate division Zixibacteria bacterium]|nr:type III-B CRISPR module RAMP protein Cmr4 [candidate division Zixibacteria bacterium]
MSSKPAPYWLHAITPMHVGVGRGIGFVDLPIVREKVTNWPLIPGSSVKGVIADLNGATDDARQNESADGRLLKAAFGSSGDDLANAGSLVFTDARIACFPVRSLYGTFAWVSSPMVLRRINRDLRADSAWAKLPIPEPTNANTILIPDVSKSAISEEGNKVYFEDLDFTAEENQDVGRIATYFAEKVFGKENPWFEPFRQRFAVVPDGTFDYLCETATEVSARIRIDPKTKTVASGALWYEESVPAEAIFAGLLWCDRVYGAAGVTARNLIEKFASGERLLQLGGHATTGRGQARCIFPAAGGNND